MFLFLFCFLNDINHRWFPWSEIISLVYQSNLKTPFVLQGGGCPYLFQLSSSVGLWKHDHVFVFYPEHGIVSWHSGLLYSHSKNEWSIVCCNVHAIRHQSVYKLKIVFPNKYDLFLLYGCSCFNTAQDGAPQNSKVVPKLNKHWKSLWRSD